MTEIPGLSLQLNIMSENDELAILQELDTYPWSTDLKRRTQHYGYYL